DELINLIRSAPDVETARGKLMKRYKLTELQATAILDMQLRRLAALERKKIDTEYKEVTAIIKELTTLLKSPNLMRAVVADELLKVKAAYADRRRTQIVNLKEGAKAGKTLTARELPHQAVWIGVTDDGLVSRTHDDKQPKHSGNDAPRFLVKASTTDTIYFVSKLGKAAAVAAHLIPEADKLSQGSMYYKVSPLTETDPLAVVFSLPAGKSILGEETCVLTATRFGMVKKSLVTELPGPSSQTFTLVRVNEGDRLGWVGLTDGKKKDILLATSNGMAIRFKEDDVRPMGLVAAGVNGIKLDDNDEVAGMEVLPAEGEIFLLASDGKAKRVDEKEFPRQGRYGKGVVAWDLPNKVILTAIASGKPNHVATVHMSRGAAKSARLDLAAVRKRASSKGDLVVELKPGETITGLTVGWTVERFVASSLKGKTAKEKPGKKKKEAKPVKKEVAQKPSKPAKAKAKPVKKTKKK
ncbi:MAG: DNA gyrase C-terminal beta-propeller domain-containing protein, partial [Anaerolineales bacterium]|nr:DNA gyrase C-terminal beta-propeller domain-containing protein [Anaerolineales bacterium]